MTILRPTPQTAGKKDTDDILYSITLLAGTLGAIALAVKAGFELADTIAARGRPPAPVTQVLLKVEGDEDEDEQEGGES